jgi:membrane complex biogenesis BtpA family protein
MGSSAMTRPAMARIREGSDGAWGGASRAGGVSVNRVIEDETMAVFRAKPNAIQAIFGRRKAVIGVIHLRALPGAPDYDGASMDALLAHALSEAERYRAGGVDGLIVENHGDIPFAKPEELGPETAACMAVITQAVRAATALPVGVNVLANGAVQALAVAKAAGAAFIRVNQWANAYVANEGFMEGKAGAAARYRAWLRARDVKIFADVHVKHGAHAITADRSIQELARDVEFFDADVAIATGQRTGIQALLSAESELGVKPRIIGVPELDTQGVANALAAAAQDLRAFTYVAARDPAGNYAQTKEQATAYRKEFGQREVMVLYPNFLAWDSAAGEDGKGAVVTQGAVAYALGLRAKLDQEVGWHKNISNAVINGPQGITVPVFFDLQNPASDAGYLNAQEVTTIIRRAGYRFWGSRTCEEQGGRFPFENYTRTAQVLADTIAEAHFTFIDKPMHPSLVRDMLGFINSRFRDLVNGGYLIGAEAYFDPDRNGKEDLAAGRLLISYRYTPVPPLENLIFEQSITDDFLAEFAAAIQA